MKKITLNSIPAGKTKLYIRWPARLHKRLARENKMKSTTNIAYTDLVSGQREYILPDGINQIKAIYFK